MTKDDNDLDKLRKDYEQKGGVTRKCGIGESEGWLYHKGKPQDDDGDGGGSK